MAPLAESPGVEVGLAMLPLVAIVMAMVSLMFAFFAASAASSASCSSMMVNVQNTSKVVIVAKTRCKIMGRMVWLNDEFDAAMKRLSRREVGERGSERIWTCRDQIER